MIPSLVTSKPKIDCNYTFPIDLVPSKIFFSDSFGIKRYSIWSQINWKSVITVEILLNLANPQKSISMLRVWQILSLHSTRSYTPIMITHLWHSICFFPGFLAIFTVLSSNNNTTFFKRPKETWHQNNNAGSHREMNLPSFFFHIHTQMNVLHTEKSFRNLIIIVFTIFRLIWDANGHVRLCPKSIGK